MPYFFVPIIEFFFEIALALFLCHRYFDLKLNQSILGNQRDLLVLAASIAFTTESIANIDYFATYCGCYYRLFYH